MDELLSPPTEAQKTAFPPGARTTIGGRVRGALRDLLGTIVPAVVIALLIHAFLAQATRVYGQSMEPNLHTDERLVVEKLSYRFHGPRRGDIVVLRDPSGGPELLIKRVVGLPGERVSMSDGRVYIDGAALTEPYLSQSTQGGGRSWLVPPLTIFVMGDNRNASRDSRVFGPVSLNQIIGRALFRYWPPSDIGVVY
ncbi:MAG: signal peptidase [Chloroflexota bacterium]|nr:signal peptidase [Chloroflexota bacterium]